MYSHKKKNLVRTYLQQKNKEIRSSSEQKLNKEFKFCFIFPCCYTSKAPPKFTHKQQKVIILLLKISLSLLIYKK